MIINGGMRAERFELHNFDVLMSGLEIRSHVYRYFFTPPKPSDREELSAIAEASASSEFKVPVGGFNALENFEPAVRAAIEHPERGKQFFALQKGEDNR